MSAGRDYTQGGRIFMAQSLPLSQRVVARPPRPEEPGPLPRRSLRMRLAGVHVLHCGCLVTTSMTCPHGWMVRML